MGSCAQLIKPPYTCEICIDRGLRRAELLHSQFKALKMAEAAKAECLSRFPNALKRSPASYFKPKSGRQRDVDTVYGQSCPFYHGFAGRLTRSGFIYNDDEFQMPFDVSSQQVVDDDSALEHAAEEHVRDWRQLQDALEMVARLEPICATGQEAMAWARWTVIPVLLYADRLINETTWAAYEFNALLAPKNPHDNGDVKPRVKDCVGMTYTTGEHWDYIYKGHDGVCVCETCEGGGGGKEEECKVLWTPLMQAFSDLGVQDVHWVSQWTDHPGFVGGLVPGGGYLCGVFVAFDGYYWTDPA
ncbi:hypothetical protein B5M09_007729 [Aphanomyces astaci]|uniref:Uncharacterized protein n=2 Tax=Aphanomyces astaci TaxID=112090 RepID=A0A425DGW3_APHAT|nr:hypothetical protein B5M09_007729 [Aphanomyces astaci]